MEGSERFDTHIHTRLFSADGEMTLGDALLMQKETGLGIVLTEHMDFDFPSDMFDYSFDGLKYFRVYGRARSETFLLGAEVGLRKEAVERNRAFTCSAPFDMIVGSTHVCEGEDLYMPSYFALFPDKKSAYTCYLQTMYENIRQFRDFDTMAHIDYIARHAPYKDPYLRYEEHGEEIDRVLAALAEDGKSLEINTRLFGKPEAVREYGIFLNRFRELGGRTVTVGSDAHRARDIGAYVSTAYELAQQCGLVPVVYRSRKPQRL